MIVTTIQLKVENHCKVIRRCEIITSSSHVFYSCSCDSGAIITIPNSINSKIAACIHVNSITACAGRSPVGYTARIILIDRGNICPRTVCPHAEHSHGQEHFCK